jgi:hypothetical protein
MTRRGPEWTDEEIALVRQHRDEPVAIIAALLPHRSVSAIKNVKYRVLDILDHGKTEQPPVKAAGDYIETLSAYFVDDWECLSIWLKWNGYHAYRELSRDMGVGALGIATLLCTAK